VLFSNIIPRRSSASAGEEGGRESGTSNRGLTAVLIATGGATPPSGDALPSEDGHDASSRPPSQPPPSFLRPPSTSTRNTFLLGSRASSASTSHQNNTIPPSSPQSRPSTASARVFPTRGPGGGGGSRPATGRPGTGRFTQRSNGASPLPPNYADPTPAPTQLSHPPPPLSSNVFAPAAPTAVPSLTCTPQQAIDKRLPTAHTCFFSLHLPRYSSDEVMRKNLLYAIENGVEMDGDYRVRGDDGNSVWADE